MNINNDDYFDENEETYWDFMTKLVNFTINSTTIGDDNYYEKYKGVIIAYSIIVIVSVFGNTLVCYVIFRHKKLQTVTNLFITNLAISDLLMTVLNIPFNLIRLLSDNWPFGVFMCQLVPHVQVTSAYVSTLTMTCIAIDRYAILIINLGRTKNTLYNRFHVCIDNLHVKLINKWSIICAFNP